ncbi:spore coat protein [Bacillus sp. B15-48]|uniref:spore coat protein n=1 Tax=Bacillus sp. B15-48 TaxID=1548601 RepID=UPI00193EDF9A|nr:spore coat protein [Bacillus sp. B15-48]MBM4765176.1 hypothetical protein [Bacillus sp. B15-48]
MPFGAHEAMEVHEVLSEKINMISHFNIYAQQTQNQQLMEMINRHQQEEINSYDAIVAYTHDYTQFTPIPPNTSVSQVTPDQIQYGLNDPTMIAPETNAVLNDYEVAMAMLHCHKNAAANGVKAALEIADPNLRQMLTNGAINCINQAYEVFLFMNEQGLYQVPELKDHTAKTFLHSYQPSGESLKAQYTMQPGQNQGQDNPMKTYMQSNQMGSQQKGFMPYGQAQHGTGAQMGAQSQNMTSASGMAKGQPMNNPYQQRMTMGKTGQMGNTGMNPVYQNNPPYQGNQNFNH